MATEDTYIGTVAAHTRDCEDVKTNVINTEDTL